MTPINRARAACIEVAGEAFKAYNEAMREKNVQLAGEHWAARKAAFACERKIAAIVAEAACEHDWEHKSLFEKTCRRCGMVG